MENLIAEVPIVVGDRRGKEGLNDGRSYITTTTANGAQKDDMSEGGLPERKKGTSGWTKVKSRSEDVLKK
jgi:hypothetical protein